MTDVLPHSDGGKSIPDKCVFEALRGEPIVERPQGMDVPAYETFDQEKFCQKPLVSVVMLAYNHEKFIAQAVEGVMMQKCDFAYELLLCEDCSSDKTREICFEFQRRYPENVKVLWYDANVSKLGGNTNRALARCRGEFIAFCEGDDYWTDCTKLARQVELMRKYPSAGICLGGTDYYSENRGEFVLRYDASRVRSEFEPGINIARRALIGSAISRALYAPSRHFSTFLCRREQLEALRAEYPDVCRSNWRFGDTCILAAIASRHDVCYLRSQVSVYRLNDTGITRRSPALLMRNVQVFNVLASVRLLRMPYAEALDVFSDKIVWSWFQLARRGTDELRSDVLASIRSSTDLSTLFSRFHCRRLFKVIERGSFSGFFYACARFSFIIFSSIRKLRIRSRYGL